jgi:tRNA(His) 5'-end guanylyltransferase
MSKADSLGDRIKGNYEDRYRFYFPRRTNTILRIDGRGFHNLVKKIKAEKPYDVRLMKRMDDTAKFLCENIEGAKIAFVQSDEISILLTDYSSIDTQAWFDGNLQKIVSVSASLATAYFNANTEGMIPALATFDSRAFIIPDPTEISNYFLWRKIDWERNSISMLARSNYSHKELHGKKVSDMHEMLYKKNINWAKMDQSIKNGRLIVKRMDGWKVIPAQSDRKEFREFIMDYLPKNI